MPSFKRPKPTTVVLGLLCVMYMITYVDRVNISTAADSIKRELALSNIQLGFLQSAFGYPYLVFQIFGGWIGDRFGPRRTLFLCGLIWATATILTGFAGGLTSLFLCRLLVGIGEGATFPVATRAMQSWTAIGRRGFAQGLTHAFARLGNAITPPIVAWLIVTVEWRGSFIALGCCSLVWVLIWVWYFRDTPADHPAITRAELERLPSQGAPATVVRPRVPWAALTKRMAPVTIVYFCYGWTLWLYLTWLPSYFLHEYKFDLKKSALFTSAVFFAGVVGDYLGGVISDRILHRTGDLQKARRNVVMIGFLGSFVCLVPVFLTHDLAHPAAHFRRQDDVLPPPRDGLPDHRLRLARGVDVGGVDEVDARIERAMHDAVSRSLIEAADLFPDLSGASEGHRAQTELRNEHTGISQLAIFH